MTTYEQIKNCPYIEEKTKKRALKDLRLLQRSKRLQEKCGYKQIISGFIKLTCNELYSILIIDKNSTLTVDFF